MTLMLTSLAPGFKALVASTRYGVCQTSPSDLPFTVTSARFFTSPRSIHSFAPFLNQSGEVLHPRIRAVSPRDQVIQRNGGRCATTWLEAHIPRTVHRREFRLHHLRQSER